MRQIDKNTFFDITENFSYVPYTQSRGWWAFHSIKDENRFMFFVDSTEKPQIACMGHIKKFLSLKMLQIDGECFFDGKNIDSKKIREFYKEITQKGFDMIEIQSNTKWNFNYEIALRQAGFLHPIGQFSMPVTKIIDLTQEIIYDENWRRFIRKSLKNNLTMEVIDTITKKDCMDFIQLQNALNERKKLSINYSTVQIFALCSDRKYQLFFATYNGQRVAALIVHKNEKTKHVHLNNVASNDIARQTSASYFIYFTMLQYLQKNGYLSFDLEKLIPAVDGVNNVFKFKNGIVGEYQRLNGEFSWYKRSYYRHLMYFVKKYLMKKREF